MKTFKLFVIGLFLSFSSSAQTVCTSTGSGSWNSSFSCTGSGGTSTYIVQSGHTVSVTSSIWTSIDTIIVRGTLQFNTYRYILMSTTGLIQVASGGQVIGNTYPTGFVFFYPGTSILSNFNITGPSYATGFTSGTFQAGSLPVTWMDVSAESRGQDINVQWSTASEWNNDRFEIEYSINGENFQRVQTVNSLSNNGNSNDVLNYESSFRLEEQRPVVYVRIKQIDFDGTSSYSEIHMVEMAAQKLTIRQSAGSVQLETEMLGPKTIQVLDMSGRLVYETNTTEEIISIAFETPGVYLIRVYNKTEALNQKILVQ